MRTDCFILFDISIVDIRAESDEHINLGTPLRKTIPRLRYERKAFTCVILLEKSRFLP